MTNRHTPQSGPDEDPERLADQRQRLDKTREELIEYRPDITDEALRAHVTYWLQRSADADAGSAREHVTQELADVQTGNAMYRTPRTREFGAEFPARCAGDDPENPRCPHYGVACPIVTDNMVKRRLNRVLDEESDPARLREKLREIAIENSCHVIQEALKDITHEYEPLIKEGQTLLMAVEDLLLPAGGGEAAVTRALAAEHVQTPPDIDVHVVQSDAPAPPAAGVDVAPEGGDGVDDAPADARTDGGTGGDEQ